MAKPSDPNAHSFVARNFAHLYAVGGRQHSMDTVAKMQEASFKEILVFV